MAAIESTSASQKTESFKPQPEPVTPRTRRCTGEKVGMPDEAQKVEKRASKHEERARIFADATQKALGATNGAGSLLPSDSTSADAKQSAVEPAQLPTLFGDSVPALNPMTGAQEQVRLGPVSTNAAGEAQADVTELNGHSVDRLIATKTARKGEWSLVVDMKAAGNGDDRKRKPSRSGSRSSRPSNQADSSGEVWRQREGKRTKTERGTASASGAWERARTERTSRTVAGSSNVAPLQRDALRDTFSVLKSPNNPTKPYILTETGIEHKDVTISSLYDILLSRGHEGGPLIREFEKNMFQRNLEDSPADPRLAAAVHDIDTNDPLTSSHGKKLEQEVILANAFSLNSYGGGALLGHNRRGGVIPIDLRQGQYNDAQSLLRAGFVSKDDTVIDVGTGQGGFAEMLVEKGISVTAIEPSGSFFRSAQRAFPEVINADSRQFISQNPEKKFDVVHVGNFAPNEIGADGLVRDVKDMTSRTGRAMIGISSANPECVTGRTFERILNNNFEQVRWLERATFGDSFYANSAQLGYFECSRPR